VNGLPLYDGGAPGTSQEGDTGGSGDLNESSPAAGASRRFVGYAFLVAAALTALGVGAFLFLSADDGAADASNPQTNGLDFGTPFSKLPGAPTPYPDTGVLQPQRPKEGELAPDFALVDARDGRTVRKLSDYRGKAVIINWYASWCAPCKAEIPEFQAAYVARGDQLVVLGVDYIESQEKAAGILSELGATYPAVLDTTGAVAEHYRVTQGLPTTFFVDKDGILRGTRTGQVLKDQLSGYLAQVGVTYKPD
jgi:peroxiredoxin